MASAGWLWRISWGIGANQKRRNISKKLQLQSSVSFLVLVVVVFFNFPFIFFSLFLEASVHGLLDTSQCEVCYLSLAGFLKTLQPKLRLLRPK